MKIKKFTSILLSVMLILTVVCGCFVVSADAASTITYSFVVTTPEEVNAFEGEVIYPSDSLSVSSITFSGQSNNKNGKILFNASNASIPFDFSNGSNMITVVFNVNGDYNEKDIYCNISEFYSNALVAFGNIPFDYENVIDSEVVASGHTDLDDPANSYENTKYSVVYSYMENPNAADNSTYTKTVWSHFTDLKQTAELGMPRFENPYFGDYNVISATLSGSNVINASLGYDTKTYSVNLDGADKGEYSYLDTATVEVDEEKDFLINGVRVARGKAYSFFVTGDTDITTEEPAGEVVESASLVSNALYLSDSQSGANVKMEMLASVTSTGFSRMGVAFSASEKAEADIKAAVSAVTTGTGTQNKIAVHNSSVDMPNVSGQYQFIYAPYLSAAKVSKDKSLYFYAFVVNENGDITVSTGSQVNFANVLA